MLPLSQSGYSSDQVKSALVAARRVESFRYDLLDSTNTFKTALATITAGNVANNALAQIKRTAKFTMRDDGTVTFLSDRIKPWYRIKMPDGGWAEFPLGVFILSTPPRKDDPAAVIWRDVEAYDLLQILVDDKVTNRYTVTAGTKYTDAVGSLLSGARITQTNITASTATLPATRDWKPGTTKLQIINDLLAAINYRSLYFDANGVAIAQPYMSPDQRASEYTYSDDDQSVILPGVEQTLDLFAIPNEWVLVVSESDRPALSSTYTNSNANSPTSTTNRGRTIVSYQEGIDAADQTTLDNLAQRTAFEASQVYEEVKFQTAIMPMHADLDVLTLNYSRLGLSAKYSEQSWDFDLAAGATMNHSIRRVVSV